jgi:hypothetical protein
MVRRCMRLDEIFICNIILANIGLQTIKLATARTSLVIYALTVKLAFDTKAVILLAA